MGSGTSAFLRGGLRWLNHRPAYMVLTATPQELAGERPERFRRAWAGLILLSLAWGILSRCLYGWAWDVDGTQIPLLPGAAVAALMALWLFRRCIMALARAIAGEEPAGIAVAGAALVVVLLMAFINLKRGEPEWVHGWVAWICPRAIYRALILAPVWGAWAMLIVGQFCKPRAETEPQVTALVGGCGAFAASLAMILPLAGTLLYLQFLGWRQLVVAGVALLSAIGGGMLLCRRGGGLRRETLLACNLLTQLAFLLAYIAVR